MSSFRLGIPIVATLFGIYGVDLITSNLNLEDGFKINILIGASLGILSLIFELHLRVNELHEESRKDSRGSFTKFVDLLRLDNKFYNNQWLHDVLKNLVHIHRHTSNHPYLLKLAQNEINNGLKVAEELSRGKRIELSGDDKEVSRQMKLKEIVENSAQYVNAVTSYDPDYWGQFWFQNSSCGYTESNILSAKKGVIIKRIFILPDEVLLGNDAQICKKLSEVIKPMLNISNLDVYFVALGDIPKDLEAFQHTNFLVSDDLFVSLSGEEKNHGYMSIRESNEVHRLNRIFSKLMLAAKSAKTFNFLTKKYE